MTIKWLSRCVLLPLATLWNIKSITSLLTPLRRSRVYKLTVSMSATHRSPYRPIAYPLVGRTSRSRCKLRTKTSSSSFWSENEGQKEKETSQLSALSAAPWWWCSAPPGEWTALFNEPCNDGATTALIPTRRRYRLPALQCSMSSAK